MLKLVVSKVFKFMSLCIAISILTFFLLECSPIDPVTAYVGADSTVSAEQRMLIAEHWGLDNPPLERFISWFKSMATGDWGTSMIYRRPVLEILGTKFMASIGLLLMAWLISGVFGFILGVISGMNEGNGLDKVIRLYCHVTNATPTFWLGILMIMIFAVHLNWFPIALSVPLGVESNEVDFLLKLKHMVLPAMTLGVIGISSMCLHTREKVIQAMRSAYVLFAISQGKSKGFILRKHVLKNVLLPAITLQFLSFSELFGGAVFVEQVFSYPGLGKAAVEAGLRSDLPLLLGIVLVSLGFVFVGNLIADVLYRLVDPRIGEEEHALKG